MGGLFVGLTNPLKWFFKKTFLGAFFMFVALEDWGKQLIGEIVEVCNMLLSLHVEPFLRYFQHPTCLTNFEIFFHLLNVCEVFTYLGFY
jgi:hypothetical protein